MSICFIIKKDSLTKTQGKEISIISETNHKSFVDWASKISRRCKVRTPKISDHFIFGCDFVRKKWSELFVINVVLCLCAILDFIHGFARQSLEILSTQPYTPFSGIVPVFEKFGGVAKTTNMSIVTCKIDDLDLQVSRKKRSFKKW